MLVMLLFAFASGVVTILSPCILPVLPIVLSAGAGGGRGRPLGIVAGFVAGFAFFTLALSAIVEALHVPADSLRVLAVFFIGAFGLVILVPALREGFERLASRLASRLPSASPKTDGSGAPRRLGAPLATAGAHRGGGSEPRRGSGGFWGGTLVGLSLGLVWTPCVGPIMASIISLALGNRVDAGAVVITLAYAAGTAIPMLGIMLGGRGLLSRLPGLARRMASIQRGFGAVMLAMALVIALQWDRRIQAAILEAFPSYGSGLTAFEDNPAVRKAIARREGSASGAGTDVLAPISTALSASTLFAGSSELSSRGLRLDLGLAPPLVAAGPWFNTEGPGKGPSRPLTEKDLRGKVLLIDFWTYSCINCIRTLPWLRAWNKAYADKGLVIIGVHSPEFAFEREPSNVQKAIAELGVTWPVVMDNNLAEWRAWSNRYWPAHYLVDTRGRVRAWRFGEGDYEGTEAEIRALLAESGTAAGPSSSPKALSLASRTPETYLGYERARGFASAVKPLADKATKYLPARSPGVGEWNLRGIWTIKGHYLESSGKGSLSLGFDARDVYLVVEAGEGGGSLDVSVDGSSAADTEDVKAGSLVPVESRAYHLLGRQGPGLHVLTLEVTGSLRLYAFTFG